MIRYTIFTAVVIGGAIFATPWATGLSGSTATWISIAGLVAILIMLVRILRMGTVAGEDGITRRGFLGDRRPPWSDIHELALVDRGVVHVANGFQVSSRYVVTVSVGERRRRKTLLFVDERGFTTAAYFRAELDLVATIWDERRSAGA